MWGFYNLSIFILCFFTVHSQLIIHSEVKITEYAMSHFAAKHTNMKIQLNQYSLKDVKTYIHYTFMYSFCTESISPKKWESSLFGCIN